MEPDDGTGERELVLRIDYSPRGGGQGGEAGGRVWVVSINNPSSGGERAGGRDERSFYRLAD
jgi:hypothetical protein